jgi:hypothetical protein
MAKTKGEARTNNKEKTPAKAEGDSWVKVEEKAARAKAEEEARVRVEQEARAKAEEEARVRDWWRIARPQGRAIAELYFYKKLAFVALFELNHDLREPRPSTSDRALASCSC